MKLEDSQKNILRLAGRSKRDAEAFSKVSDVLWPLVSSAAATMPELLVCEHIGNSGRVKLTPEAEILLKYVL